jgi:FtsZ-binding cell division protein ZapB
MSKKRGGGRWTVVPPSKIFGPVTGRRIEVSNVIVKLDAAIEEVKGRVDALQAKERELAEKRANLDREIALGREEQVRLQGEHRALVTMRDKESSSSNEQPN